MSPGPASPWRRRLFPAAALLLSVALLGALELALRLADYGGSHPLFVDYAEAPGLRLANPELMHRYVSSTGEPIARIDPFLFAAEKPADGYRIVVQGGSTAAGFPYGRFGGLAGMLGDRLEATFPGRPIEVVSTAMAAVNSYTLLDLVDEILAIEPDAVLVYTGHNEYLGVFGVASALRGFDSLRVARLQLRLGRSRLYQLVQQLVALGGAVLRGTDGADRNTLFALAASGSQVAFGSELDRAGRRQLEANLDALLGRYRSAGIPVYIGTLVANEKDLAPFVGGPRPEVDATAWGALRAEQRAHLEAGRLDDARRAARRMIELDANSADAWYALGQTERAAGRLDAAREALRGAKDRDRLRFRAPESFNRLIRELAARHGATLVDVQQRFVEASPEGLLGHELLLEHVHPNAEGYFLLADAYHEALRRDGRIGDWSGAPDREQARRDMPLTEVDRLLAEYDTREMKAGFPFSDPPRPARHPAPASEVERLARRHRDGELDWTHMMEALLQLYHREGRLADAARIARLTAQEHPHDRGPNFVAGALLLEQGQHARARRYLERSLLAAPDDVPTLAALLQVDLALGDAAREEEHRARLESLAPRHPRLARPPARAP